MFYVSQFNTWSELYRSYHDFSVIMTIWQEAYKYGILLSKSHDNFFALFHKIIYSTATLAHLKVVITFDGFCIDSLRLS